jgi:hypothetical protein
MADLEGPTLEARQTGKANRSAKGDIRSVAASSDDQAPDAPNIIPGGEGGPTAT